MPEIFAAILIACLICSVTCVIAGAVMGRNMEKLRQGERPHWLTEHLEGPDLNECGCGHHRSFHDEQSSGPSTPGQSAKLCLRCGTDVRRRRICRGRDKYGDLNCGCQQFVSKVPSSEIIKPMPLLDQVRRELDGL